MVKFLARRLLSIFISLIGATIFIFILTRLGPDPLTLYIGDAQVELSEEQIQLIKEQLGLDKNLPMQYLDLGMEPPTVRLGAVNWHSKRPVSEIIRIHIAVTLILACRRVDICHCCWHQHWHPCRSQARYLLGLYRANLRADGPGYTPVLVRRPCHLLLRSSLKRVVWFGFLPHRSGIGEYDGFPLHWGNAKYYILPCIVLGWPASASIMRLTRSSMLEILDSEFIKLARAKGVNPVTVIWKHGFA